MERWKERCFDIKIHFSCPHCKKVLEENPDVESDNRTVSEIFQEFQDNPHLYGLCTNSEGNRTSQRHRERQDYYETPDSKKSDSDYADEEEDDEEEGDEPDLDPLEPVRGEVRCVPSLFPHRVPGIYFDYPELLRNLGIVRDEQGPGADFYVEEVSARPSR